MRDRRRSGIAPRGLWAAPFACLLLLLQAAPLRATPTDYVIRDFQVDLRVERRGGLQVQERIEVEFESPRHGIYRVIPVKAESRGGFVQDLDLEFDAAVDTEGRVLRTHVRRDGPNVRIRIGDPDRTVQGIQTYVLRYRVVTGVDFRPEHDELYWNVTGDEWPVPIGQASARIELPAPVPAADVEWALFTGERGARGSDAEAEYADGRFTVRTTNELPAWSGLTFALGWPKGIVAPPSLATRAARFGRWNWPLLLPFAVAGFAWRRWRTRGRDPRSGGSVMVQYEPPPGLGAAEVGALIDERADLQDLTAAVVELAIRGHLRIEQNLKRVLGIFDGEEYTLVQLAPPAEAPPLKAHEQALLAGLFERGSTVRLADLRQRFYTHVPKIKSGIYEELVRAGLFEANPETVRRRWLSLGFVLMVAGGLLAVFWAQRQGGSPRVLLPPLLGAGLSGLVLMLAAQAMPRRTRQGVAQTRWARGLEEFIRRVESPRIETHEREGLDPRQRFERVLPYAMALGVASRWAAAFAGVYTEPPTWFRGGTGDGFSSTRFVSGLESMRGRMASDMTSAPRSSGGSSGLGGGGFSGGGRGGGGGGAW